MSKQQYRVKVNKVPLENKHYDTSPQVFPRMPRLYLEIIENKAKIKQDLINKEYIPKEIGSGGDGVYETGSPVYKESSPTRQKNQHYYRKEEDVVKTSENFSVSSSIDDGDMKELLEKFNDKSKHETMSISSSDTNDVIRAAKNLDETNSISSYSTAADNRDPGNAFSGDEDGDDPVTARLKQLLADTDSEKSPSPTNDKYSRSHEQYKPPPMLNAPANAQPPSLAELEAKGQYQKSNDLRDINRVTLNEREEEDLKREYLFKFEILKKSYKEASIPEYSIHTDLSTLEKSYNATVRSLSLDASVDYYKKLLIGAFMVVEYALGKWLRLDMEGYTKQQIVSMSSYEQLLIELGEKSYRPSGKGYPVELRLLGMVIMNTAIFLFTKMVMRNTGSNLLGMLNNMTNSAPSQPKRKMRGPDINLNDIPDLDDEKA